MNQDAVPDRYTLRIDRDGVHASDDAPSRWIDVARQITVRDAVLLGVAENYLPSISGGRATWVAEWVVGPSGAYSPVAVCAQQWLAPRFLVSPDLLLDSKADSFEPRLRFRYRNQADPATTVDELLSLHGGLRQAR